MTDRLFLEEHSPDCNLISNPCPTCRAWELIKAHGLDDDMRTLLQERHQGQVDILHTPLSKLELSIRTMNTLSAAGFNNLDQVCQKTEAELLRIDRFGRKSLNEIKKILGNHGYQLGHGEENG